MPAHRVQVVLWAVILLVIAGNVAAQLTDHHTYLGRSIVMGLFDVTAESSLPTWLSSVLFLLSALMILLVRPLSSGKRAGGAWVVVAFILVALSIDEVASLHETTSRAIRRTLHLDGVLYYAWLLPAVILLGIALVVLLPWLIRLPARLRRSIIIAAAVFLTGTIVFEMIGSYLDSSGLQSSSQYVVTSSVEESLEIIGVGLLFSALVGHAWRESLSDRK